MRTRSKARTCAGALLLRNPIAPAHGAGASGSFRLSAVQVEGETIFLRGSSIQNPDDCASSAFIVNTPDMPRQDRYLSIAFTTHASGKPVPL